MVLNRGPQFGSASREHVYCVERSVVEGSEGDFGMRRRHAIVAVPCL